jgi:hypothetical protein
LHADRAWAAIGVAGGKTHHGCATTSRADAGINAGISTGLLVITGRLIYAGGIAGAAARYHSRGAGINGRSTGFGSRTISAGDMFAKMGDRLFVKLEFDDFLFHNTAGSFRRTTTFFYKEIELLFRLNTNPQRHTAVVAGIEITALHTTGVLRFAVARCWWRRTEGGTYWRPGIFCNIGNDLFYAALDGMLPLQVADSSFADA